MNQILISKKIYETPEMRRKRMVYRILYLLSVILIMTLLGYYVYAEKTRSDQEAIGQEILQQASDDTVVETQAIVIALDDNEERDSDSEEEEVVPLTIGSGQRTVTTSDGKTYSWESTLSYGRLGIRYNVLAEENEELLKVSLCKYWGPNPNETGNYCIVGHNYRNGRMFGKLNSAKNGDVVELSDTSGRTVKYEVYNIYVVEPTDVSCTSQLTDGKKELTLITCTNYGKQRLIVKAREV